jgi:hypothetical protein
MFEKILTLHGNQTKEQKACILSSGRDGGGGDE